MSLGTYPVGGTPYGGGTGAQVVARVPGVIRSVIITSFAGTVETPISIPATVNGPSAGLSVESFPGDLIFYFPVYGDRSIMTLIAFAGTTPDTSSLTNNDKFSEPLLIDTGTLSGSITIDLSNAVYTEPGETDWWGNGGTYSWSKWFIWIAPADGLVNFDLQNAPSQWDVIVWPDVWPDFATMAWGEPYDPINGNDNWLYPYSVEYEQNYNQGLRIPVLEGQRFRIRVDDYYAQANWDSNPSAIGKSDVVLVWDVIPSTKTFVNDDLADCIDLAANQGTIGPYYYDSGGSIQGESSGNFVRHRIPNVTPTYEESASEPVFDSNPWNRARDTTWYKWTATYTGPFQFTTFGSTSDDKYGYYGDPVSNNENGLDTVAKVFTADYNELKYLNYNDLVVVSENDDGSDHTDVYPYLGYNSQIDINVTWGVTYVFQVDYYYYGGQAGDLYINWGAPPAPVPTTAAPGSVVITGSRASVNVESFPGVLLGTFGVSPAYVSGVRASMALTSFPGTIYQAQAKATGAGLITLYANGGFVSAGQSDAGLFLEARARVGQVDPSTIEMALAIDAFGDNGSNQYMRSLDNGATFSYAPVGLRRGFSGVINEEIAIVGGLQQVVQSDPALSYPLATSTNNGTSWTQRQVPMQSVLSVADNGFLYVASGAGTASAPRYCIATSSDGITWTGRTSPFTATGDEVYDVIWTGTEFVGIAPFATGIHVASSSDGANWSAFKTMPTPPSQTTRRGSEANTVRDGVLHMYVEDQSVVTGRTTTLLRSDNGGNSWTVLPVTVGGSTLYGTPYDVVYVPRLEIFLLAYRDVNGNRLLATSGDGVNYTQRSTGIRPQVVGFDSKYLYAGGGTGTTNRFARSTDGVNWTPVSIGAPQVSRLINYSPRARGTFSVDWNGTDLGDVTVGPGWFTLGYDVFFDPDRHDVLTLQGLAGFVEIRRVRVQEAVDAYLFGAYPQGDANAWPVSALDGAFGRPYELLLSPTVAEVYTIEGYVTVPGAGVVYFDRPPAPVIVIPQTAEGETARIRFIPTRHV